MKKNTMMRLASVLLIAVLMSTCAISGTFAKYVTSETGTDSARVAKFGVEVSATGYLFAKTYVNFANGNVPGTADMTISSSTDEDVLAPGSKSNDDGMVISITGTPEVDVAVTHDATINLTGWNYVDESSVSHFYCPLVFTIDGTVIDGSNYYDNYTLFVNALTEAIETQSAEYDVNTNLALQAANSVQISWVWPYETTIGSKNCDVMDTYLGDQAADGTPAKVEITITTTVTQID